MDIQPNDKKSLEIYRRQVGLLFDRPALRQGRLACSIKYQRQEDGTMATWFDLGMSEDELISMATHFRLIYADKEPANFNRIRGIVGKIVKYQGSHELLKRFGNDWKKALTGMIQIKFTIDGEEIDFTGKKAIEIWFNGRIFHANDDHFNLYNKITRNFGPAFEFKIYETFNHLLMPIYQLDQFVEQILTQKKEPTQVTMVSDDKRRWNFDLVSNKYEEINN